jgi:hypothetical protein
MVFGAWMKLQAVKVDACNRQGANVQMRPRNLGIFFPQKKIPFRQKFVNIFAFLIK